MNGNLRIVRSGDGPIRCEIYGQLCGLDVCGGGVNIRG
jgi:hypothetical protein